MNQMFRSLIVGVALSFAAGCGAPSNLDLCHENCSNEKKCNRASDADYANCNKSCNDNAGSLMQDDQDLAKSCSNSGDLRKQQANCFGNSDACSQAALVTCYASVLKNCIKP